MTKIICIYHKIDQDGWCSAAIVKDIHPTAQLIGYNYGDPIPQIDPNAIVIMCDVCFSMEEMQKIQDISEDLIWIDHHKSNIEKYNQYASHSDNIWYAELPDNNESACELTWKFFHYVPTPKAVRLLGLYDTFRHKGTPEEQDALYFQNTANKKVDSPEKAMVYLTMTDAEIEKWIEEGGKIQQQKNIEAKEIYKTGKPVIIDGYKFIMFNADRFNPINNGIDYHKDGFDGSGCYMKDNNGIWHMSLYNDNGNIDCSAICKKFGGGGHKGAAGCEPTEEMLHDILNGKYAKI